VGSLCHRTRLRDFAPFSGTRFTVLVCALAFLGAPALAQETAKPSQKVLGLRVESFDLSDKGKAALFDVVQRRLAAYKAIELISPPEAELTDLMIDLGCLDIDVDCLTKVGRKRMADRVFYVQVDADGKGFLLTVRLIDVTKGAAERDRQVKIKRQSRLSSALESEIVAAFGKPPPPPVAKGRLIIVSDAGAKIYIDGGFAGSGQLKLKKPPGLYVVRISKPGFEDALFRVDLKAGKTSRKVAELKPVAASEPSPVEPTPKPAADVKVADTDPGDGPAFYETWWFWTIVGSVVVTGATVGAVAGSGSAPNPTGDVQISVDPTSAWRDVAIPAGRSP